MLEPLSFQVNAQPYTEACAPGSSLLSLLRRLGWAGVHAACASGDCGSCTVWLEGEPIHSCLYPAQRIGGHAVTTIEGVAQDGQLSPLQQAFLAHQGFQCGFCTPGMILSAEKLSGLSEADLRLALRGNLCRCTGYQAIVNSILNQPEPSEPVTTGAVGQSIAKQDGPALVTGQPVYTADWSPPGLLHLKVLRSPHAHARIRQIRTDLAKALPGVHAVLTYADVPRRAYTTAGHAEPVPDPLDHFLLDYKVRFVGDRVAAVVAESVAIAEQACQLLEVEYELLPFVLDPELAMNGSSVIIHDEPESQQIYARDRNIAGHVALESGNIAQGFAAADFILEATYTLPAVQHAHLEPHVSTSWLDEDGTLVIRTSTQVPFHCQRILSEILDLPRDKIRVFKAQIGGGFGNKQEVLSEDLCALATLRTGRPVQWEFTRTEEFTATNSRHAMTLRLKTGVKADGTLVAQDLEAIGNTGAYGNHGQTVVFLAGYLPLGLYRCANTRFRGYAVYTNTLPAGAFRGYGATQGSFAMESHLDEIARQLGLDPLELRRKNLIRPGDPIGVGRSEDHFNLIGSYALDECFTKVVQALDYVPGQPPRVEGLRRRGLGFAVSMQGSGLSKVHTAGVRLSLEPEGHFCLKTGAVDVGTGSDTSLRQIAAQILDVSVGDLQLISADTHRTPFDAGSYASSTIYISGQAVNLAAQNLRGQLLNFAAQLWQTPAETLVLAAGAIRSATQQLSLGHLAQLAQAQQQPLVAELAYAADESSLTFAVLGVEVEVDTETGKIQVLRCVQAIDLGTAINPRICRGQAIGGTVMGLGYALSEELWLDQQGRILNPGFRTYRIPTAADVPPIEVILVQKADPYGPLGAKGVGEITTNCIAPAIANAVAHATGVRLSQLPMTPERVWRALNRDPA